jgi:hypothetical protein
MHGQIYSYTSNTGGHSHSLRVNGTTKTRLRRSQGVQKILANTIKVECLDHGSVVEAEQERLVVGLK